MDKIKQWMYYFIIGIVSFIALVFLPMIGSDVGLGWNIPNTVVGWVVWVTVKLIVAVLNVLIFHCFMLQAKINIKDNEKYIEANQILIDCKEKEWNPRGPQAWNKQQYGTKGITIFVTTALSTVALTQALLTFDWMSMLTYLFTIVMGLIFGIMQMKTAEDYWTDEYWQYAKMVQRKVDLAEKEHSEQGDSSVCNNRGTDILEPGYYFDPISLTVKPVVVDSDNGDNSILGGTVHTSDCPTTRSDIWTKETSQAFKETT